MLVQLNDRQLEQIGVSEESCRNLILSAVNTELGIRREILEETSSMNACVDSAENVHVDECRRGALSRVSAGFFDANLTCTYRINTQSGATYY